MYIVKYLEKDGIIVYTPTKTYSKERKEEFELRKWMNLNSFNGK